MKSILIPLILLSIFVSACTTDRSNYIKNHTLNKNNSATVIVYRPSTKLHKFNPEKPFVFIDGKKLGKLAVGDSLKVRLPIGIHEISIKRSQYFVPTFEIQKIDLNIVEQKDEQKDNRKIYYIRYTGYSADSSGTLELANKDDGNKRK